MLRSSHAFLLNMVLSQANCSQLEQILKTTITGRCLMTEDDTNSLTSSEASPPGDVTPPPGFQDISTQAYVGSSLFKITYIK